MESVCADLRCSARGDRPYSEDTHVRYLVDDCVVGRKGKVNKSAARDDKLGTSGVNRVNTSLDFGRHSNAVSLWKHDNDDSMRENVMRQVVTVQCILRTTLHSTRHPTAHQLLVSSCLSDPPGPQQPAPQSYHLSA